VADFFELAELMALDALDRKESCGCHLRDEYQTEEGEALRNDKEYSYVSAWEFEGLNGSLQTALHKEKLDFEFVELKQRSYK
jgi:succinate dehydrogenase / fumarate reductase flavoprotein subunit